MEKLRHLLTSPSQIILDLGADPQEVWRQIGQDIKAMIAAGIPEDMVIDAMTSKIQQFEVTDADTDTGNGTPKKSA